MDLKLLAADWMPDDQALMISPTPRDFGESEEEYVKRLIRMRRVVLLKNRGRDGRDVSDKG